MNQKQEMEDLELLTFSLNDHEYCLDIMCVREIREQTKTTPLPFEPNYMKGIINLRGTVLPIMDLTERLGMAKKKSNDRNVIVVVKYNEKITGLLVDAVTDIVALPANELQTPPSSKAGDGHNMVKAITLINDRLIRVLDLPQVIPSPQDVSV